MPERILVFHPAAIGDAVLATPVATALKANFPHASIVYLTHDSLGELLKLCPSIDEIAPYQRSEGFAGLVSRLRLSDADLIIDLAGSLKSRLATTFAGKTALHYRKQKAARPDVQPVQTAHPPIRHAVDNYLDTLSPLKLALTPPVFPTIFPGQDLMREFEDQLTAKTLIGLVPGVGKFRPHRAWPPDKWLELTRRLKNVPELALVLIGGEDDAEVCDSIADGAGGNLLNLAGRLSLPLTAALLARCRLVVAADTGPAHIAVAVGTTVVGLLGATHAQRSGPYGMEKLTIDMSHRCRCLDAKHCRIEGYTKSGACLAAIEVSEVEGKIAMALAAASTPCW